MKVNIDTTFSVIFLVKFLGNCSQMLDIWIRQMDKNQGENNYAETNMRVRVLMSVTVKA